MDSNLTTLKTCNWVTCDVFCKNCQDFSYGSVPTNFAYDNVQCVGTESTLDSCNHLNVHDCVSSEGAGVVCKRNDTTVPGIFTNIL